MSHEHDHGAGHHHDHDHGQPSGEASGGGDCLLRALREKRAPAAPASAGSAASVAFAGDGGEVHFAFALDSAALPEGQGRQLVLEARSIAIFRHEGQVHALDGICPHAGSPLGPGSVWKGMVACPWHGWRFSLTDGSSPDMPGVSQLLYRTMESDGRVFVALPGAAPHTAAPTPPGCC